MVYEPIIYANFPVIILMAQRTYLKIHFYKFNIYPFLAQWKKYVLFVFI